MSLGSLSLLQYIHPFEGECMRVCVCLALFEQFVLKLVEIAFQFACPAATARTIMGKQLRNYEVYALERVCGVYGEKEKTRGREKAE